MTVEETEHVAVERQAGGDAPFVTLRDMQEEIRNIELLWRTRSVIRQQHYQRKNAKTFTSASAVQWDATD